MSPRLTRIVEALREFYSALVAVLRWPIILALVGIDCLYGVLATVYVGAQFGLVSGVAFFLLIQSWLIYLVSKKIREENKEAKILKEGWEGRTDTDKVIKEYLDLLEEEKH
jgi:uncharacterized membrane protein